MKDSYGWIILAYSCFKELLDVAVQAATLITTFIAGFGAWIAYLTLLRTPDQQAEPRRVDMLGEDASKCIEAVVFITSNQKTTLIVTSDGLECYLEDSRPNKNSGKMWVLSKEQAREILTNRDFRVYPGYKINSGTFSIGPRRNWLYSKKIYPEPISLEQKIEKLLLSATNAI